MNMIGIVVSGLGLVLLLGPGAGLVTPPLLSPPDVEGTWVGTLKLPTGDLRIVFHITRTDDGTLAATMDSPDQGATGIPVSEVIVSGDSLRLEVQAVFGFYEGTVSADGATVDGNWNQSGLTLPLVLERTDEAPTFSRPQEPVEPYPYDEEEVAYDNAAAGIRLAGTLTVPRSEGPHPAVILISGSGPQDRNETVFSHRPFLVLADYLTRRGIAVLRYDDRGIGQSTGDFGSATSEDFAGDVRAGMAYLQGRSDIDSKRIGLAGHSEGGLIAPMVAGPSPDVAFIALMAGPGLTGEEILYAQAELISRANGASEDAIARNRAAQAKLFAIMKAESDDSTAAEKVRAAVREALATMSEEEKQRLSGIDEETLVQRQTQQLVNPWMRFFLTYDPRPALKELTCPVLAVIGEKDLQVPSKENLTAIEKALREGGNEDYLTLELPGLNHLFQTATTGSPVEYAQIEETMAPAALAAIGDWIVAHTAKQ